MSSYPPGPYHVLRRAYKFTRNLVQASLGGEAYASNEMVGHAAHSPGPGWCGGLRKSAYPAKVNNNYREISLVRHFLSTQQFLEHGDLDNVSWLPRLENPADGAIKAKSHTAPLLRL